MRKHLRDRVGHRATFTATVARLSMKHTYRGGDIPTLLLEDVRNARNQHVTDHVWLTISWSIQRLQLCVGEVVAFEARVTSYVKGYYIGHHDAYTPVRIDYRLVDLRHIRRIESLQDEDDERRAS